jgi:hypothetical protein
MSCEQRARLDREHSQAQARYQAAREALDGRIGTSSREEFLSLTHAIDQARLALDRARRLLDRHIQEHGCEELSRAASNEAAADS